MSVSFPSLPRGYRFPQSARLDSFVGGPNPRDAASPSELAGNELVESRNVTYDERGGASSRLGHVKYNGTAYGVDLIQNEFWSPLLGTKIVNAGAKLYKGTSNTVRKTFSTAERVTFTELTTKIVACHPTDGLFTSTDGVTWTAVVDADAPKGTCVATWENKVWVGRPDGSVMWSNAGDPTAWTATDFNDIWTKDTQPIVALHIASGQDILGRPLLYVFKNDSWYVITDSTTGAYSVVDATVGAASNIAVVGVGPYVYALGRRGIYRASGAQIGATNMSDKYAPLWDAAQTNLSQLPLWCAGRRKNRALFSLPRSGSTANDLSLELHTEQGWIGSGTNAMSCYSMSTGAAEETYGGSPSVAGQSYQLFSGGTDDGAAIVGWLQTRWMDLLGGYKASVLHLHVRGRGVGTVQLRKDYHETGDTIPIDMSETGSVSYDTGVLYDSGATYDASSDEPTATIYGVGAARQLSLRFDFTTSTTTAAPVLLGAGSAPQVGSFAVFLVEAMFTRIGIN